MELNAITSGNRMLIDGKAVASEKKEKLIRDIASLRSETGIVPSMRLISVGGDDSSASYIRSKMRYGKKLGVNVELTELGEKTTEEELGKVISGFSADSSTNGIVIEAPLPPHLDHTGIAQRIDPQKDIDCITEINQGKIALNREYMLPATAQAIRTLIELQEPERGSTVTIINRSPVIGRPLALMLLNRDFTVSVCHSRTHDIPKITRESDFIVVGVGKAGFLTPDHVTGNSIVIDAGINYANGKLTGDADFESIKDKVKAITPVPGGVGPVTTACMFENLLKAARAQMKNFVD